MSIHLWIIPIFWTFLCLNYSSYRKGPLSDKAGITRPYFLFDFLSHFLSTCSHELKSSYWMCWRHLNVQWNEGDAVVLDPSRASLFSQEWWSTFVFCVDGAFLSSFTLWRRHGNLFLCYFVLFLSSPLLFFPSWLRSILWKLAAKYIDFISVPCVFPLQTANNPCSHTLLKRRSKYVLRCCT